MGVQLSEEVQQAILDKDSTIVIGSISKEGLPHVTVKNTVFIQDGRIGFYELLEKSQTQKNLVYSLWFDKKVAINIITKDKKSYQVKGVPYKAIVSGHIFEEAYLDVQTNIGEDIDLSSVWLIDVESQEEESFSVKRYQLETEYPYEVHLDRLAKE
jgi:hypothetical protein